MCLRSHTAEAFISLSLNRTLFFHISWLRWSLSRIYHEWPIDWFIIHSVVLYISCLLCTVSEFFLPIRGFASLARRFKPGRAIFEVVWLEWNKIICRSILYSLLFVIFISFGLLMRLLCLWSIEAFVMILPLDYFAPVDAWIDALIFTSTFAMIFNHKLSSIFILPSLFHALPKLLKFSLVLLFFLYQLSLWISFCLEDFDLIEFCLALPT